MKKLDELPIALPRGTLGESRDGRDGVTIVTT